MELLPVLDCDVSFEGRSLSYHGKAYTTSCGISVIPNSSARLRNSPYESMTVGMPFAGSKRATWMIYLATDEY